MNNKEKFLNVFKEFEDETKKKLKNTKYSLNECVEKLHDLRFNPYYNQRDFIKLCIKIRNFESHNNNNNYYLITDETIDKLKEILEEVKHPYKVCNKATINIFSRNVNDKVLDTMNEMNAHTYTHVPIYDEEGKKLVGIFSENVLFQSIINDNFVIIDENTTFNDIKECIKIENSKEMVKFVSKDELYDNVVNDFIKEFKNKNKLSCVMVTNSGKNTEKVIGIITSWDIIGKEN